MFNDGRGGEILARSWGAHLEGKKEEKKGKGEGGAPVTCEIRVFLIAIVRRLAINRSDIYRRTPRVGGYSIQRCRGEHVQRLITILRALIVGNVVSTRLKRLNRTKDRI